MKTAFVIDIRGGEFFDDLISGLEMLNREGVPYKILFLEASDPVLIRRYKETRRQHPLGSGGSLTADIAKEREKLSEIRKRANYIIDTSNMKTAQLNEEIRSLLSGKSDQAFHLTVLSFGFKHGIPLDADMVFDLRFIPNPFYLESLRHMTGNNKKVRDYVMRFPEVPLFLETVHTLICELIPGYIREGKGNLVVALGCTGGQHRSVAIANELAKRFHDAGCHVATIHRDVAI